MYRAAMSLRDAMEASRTRGDSSARDDTSTCTASAKSQKKERERKIQRGWGEEERRSKQAEEEEEETRFGGNRAMQTGAASVYRTQESRRRSWRPPLTRETERGDGEETEEERWKGKKKRKGGNYGEEGARSARACALETTGWNSLLEKLDPQFSPLFKYRVGQIRPNNN